MVLYVDRKNMKVIKHKTIFDVLKKETKMRVRMTRDMNASIDGIHVQTLKQGETYELPKEQAKRYLKKKLAVEDKSIDKAPETKEDSGKKNKKNKK